MHKIKLKNKIGLLLSIYTLCCCTAISAKSAIKHPKKSTAIHATKSIAKSPATQITSINFAASNHQTTLIFDFTGAIPPYKVYSLNSPPQLVVDLPNVNMTHVLQNLNFTNTPIISARTSHPTKNLLRVTFTLGETVHPETLLQKIPNQADKKLIIDFTFKNAAKPVVTTTPITTAQTTDSTTNTDTDVTTNTDTTTKSTANTKPQDNLQQTQQWLLSSMPQNDDSSKNDGNSNDTTIDDSQKKSTKPATPTPKLTTTSKTTSDSDDDDLPYMTAAPASPTPATGKRVVNIIIDPGHGGKDPGTTGPLGVHEKDVVLAISKDLYTILSQQPGFHPVLTRNADYFVPLRGRLALARKYKGDLFIAIHADAYQDPYASGASVYALSPHGASTEAARWLAEKENYSELGGISLSDKSDMLRSVLLDLSQTATVSSSMQLGSNLLQQLGTIGQLHYKVVEQAPFMVLKSPDIPSVLVETGFLSNTEEEERLRNPFDQMEIAKSLAHGIENYFYRNPPPGTLVATLAAQRSKSS